MSVNRKISSAVALIALIACLVIGPAMAASHKDYADTSEKWEKAYNAGDAAGVAALYTEDGVMMPPNAKAVQGREAIAAFLKQEMSATPGFKLEIESVEHGKSGNIGYARGIYSMMDADGNTVDRGKWLELRKKVEGKWYIHSDIWNSDQPQMHEHE